MLKFLNWELSMKSLATTLFLFFALVSSSFAQNVWEQKMGQAKAGNETIYCWQQNYDGGPSYAISLTNGNIFRSKSGKKGKKKKMIPHIDFTLDAMDPFTAIGHSEGQEQIVSRLKALATDKVVRRSCHLKEFSWSKLKYSTKK